MTNCTCNWKRPAKNERMEEMIRLLNHSRRYIDQTPGRDKISGLKHALRCAALGQLRGRHPDSAFLGLVHDLARPLNDVHHGEIIAEMVRDRVSEEAYHILRTHGSYQSAIVHKTPFPDEPWSHHAKQLAAFELRSFAGDYHGPEMRMVDAVKLMERYLG